MGGSNYGGLVAVFGQQGIPSTTNRPGARSFASGWYDSVSQELWVFGGLGLTTSYSGAYFPAI